MSCGGRWHGDVGWLMAVIWPGAAWPFIFSRALGEAVCLWSDGARTVSSKFAIIQKESAMSLSEKKHRWKDKGVSSSQVMSGLCSNMIEILGSKLLSSGCLITWKFCCKGNLKRKHETKGRTKIRDNCWLKQTLMHCQKDLPIGSRVRRVGLGRYWAPCDQKSLRHGLDSFLV